MSDHASKAVLVGHCVPDSMALRSAIGSMFPGVQVERVNDADALHPVDPDAVYLVNRVPDGRFDGDGIDIVRSLAADGAAVMLISNYADAQDRAVAAGALPGFGKQDLYSDLMRQRLAAVLAPA